MEGGRELDSERVSLFRRFNTQGRRWGQFGALGVCKKALSLGEGRRAMAGVWKRGMVMRGRWRELRVGGDRTTSSHDRCSLVLTKARSKRPILRSEERERGVCANDDQSREGREGEGPKEEEERQDEETHMWTISSLISGQN